MVWTAGLTRTVLPVSLQRTVWHHGLLGCCVPPKGAAMSDLMMLLRSRIVEAARFAKEDCSTIADREHSRDVHEAVFWEALAGFAVTVSCLAQRHNHPTFDRELAECCDGAESCLLALRAYGAWRQGDTEHADRLVGLAAIIGTKEEQ